VRISPAVSVELLYRDLQLKVPPRVDCTVLFAIDPKDGTINPDRNDNIPGLEALDKADLMVLFTRWRKTMPVP